MTQREDDDVPSLRHVLGHALQLVVTEVKGHQVADLEQVGRQPRVTYVVVTGVQNLSQWRRYTHHTYIYIKMCVNPATILSVVRCIH